MHPKTYGFQHRFFNDFCSILGGFGDSLAAPGEGKKGGKRRPKATSKLTSILGRFWEGFGRVLGRFWEALGRSLGGSGEGLGPSLVRFGALGRLWGALGRLMVASWVSKTFFDDLLVDLDVFGPLFGCFWHFAKLC